MTKTTPRYFEPSSEYEDEAIVQSVDTLKDSSESDHHVVILDKTICHPQGGGQPFDTGFMYGESSKTFQIVDVRMERDSECIRHIGKFTNGQLSAGDVVKIKIDREKRFFHCQLHTAGHLVDACLHLLGFHWQPTKGYHFPNGPYVEYKGMVEQSEVEALKASLTKKAMELIEEDIPIHVRLDVCPEEARMLCGELDPMYQSVSFLRLVSIGDIFTCPCGGTHVESLSQLKSIEIPKIKIQKSKGVIQVRYNVIS